MEKKYRGIEPRTKFEEVETISASNQPIEFEQWRKVVKQLEEEGY